MTERQQVARPADNSETATPEDATTAPRDNRRASEPREYLLVRDNTVQMGQLEDNLLKFSRLARQSLSKQQVPTENCLSRFCANCGNSLMGVP